MKRRVRVTPTGEKFRREQAGHDKLAEAAKMNRDAGAHLWIVATIFGLTAEEAASARQGVTQLLDLDHLLDVSEIGCFICEHIFEKVAKQECKGEPIGYGKDGEPLFASGPYA